MLRWDILPALGSSSGGTVTSPARRESGRWVPALLRDTRVLGNC